MRYPLKWPGKGETPADRQAERYKAINQVQTTGTAKRPDPPTDVIAQSGSRGVLLTWGLPAVNFDIVGWRVYKVDENTLYHELRDRGTRQMFVEATAGTTPPTNNFFVSSMNALGKESRKVQIQAKATAETGAPTVPAAPPGYTASSGFDTSNRYGKLSYDL